MRLRTLKTLSLCAGVTGLCLCVYAWWQEDAPQPADALPATATPPEGFLEPQVPRPEPKDCIESLLHCSCRYEVWAFLESVLSKASVEDLLALLEEAKHLPRTQYAKLAEVVLARLLELDPPTGAHCAGSLSARLGVDLLSPVLMKWARKDGRGCLAFILGSLEEFGPEAEHSMSAALGSIVKGRRDFAEFVLGQKVGTLRADLMKELRLAALDALVANLSPRSDLGEIEALLSPTERYMLYCKLTSVALLAEEQGVARAFLEKMSKEEFSETYFPNQELARAVAQLDLAEEFLGRMPAALREQVWLEQAKDRFAAGDLQDAVACCQHLTTSSYDSQRLVSDFAVACIEKGDLQGALGWVRSLDAKAQFELVDGDFALAMTFQEAVHTNPLLRQQLPEWFNQYLSFEDFADKQRGYSKGERPDD